MPKRFSESAEGTRILTETRRIELMRTVKVLVGVYVCEWCQVDTPQPTDTEVEAFVRWNSKASTMWPFGNARDDNKGRWEPLGWSENAFMGGRFRLCPDCTEALRDAVATAHKLRAS